MSNLKDLLLKKRKALTNKAKIDVCIEIAILNTENCDTQQAIDQYKEVLELADESDDLNMKGKAYRYIGECLLDLHQPMEAFEYIKDYLKVAQKSKDIFEIQRAYVTIGRCFLDYSEIVKNPTVKQTAAIKSENAFIKSLQLCQQISENEENLNGNYKSQTELTSELAEMRAVSLFNLGLANRVKSDDKSARTAERYFIQCSNVSFKHKLNEMFLRSSFQQFDLNYSQSLNQWTIANSGKSRLIVEESLKVLRKNLGLMIGIPFTSIMKKIAKEIHELEAQSLVVAERFHKAAKKFRNLMRRSHNCRSNYRIKMLSAIKLSEKLPRATSNEDIILIGKIYDELGIQLVAGKYYEVALQKAKTSQKDLYFKLLNRLININQSVGHFCENIKLLESKLRWKLERNEAQICCKIIEQLLDCYLRSGTAFNQLDRVILISQQLDSLAISTGRTSIKISAVKSIINLYEELGTEALKKELAKAKEKLKHLELNTELSANENEEELNEEEDPDLSDLEISEDDTVDTLSSDSDIDLRSLSESQIEELEAVGKRGKPGKDSSFIKKNEKGESLLHVAAINGNLKQAEKLINKMDHPVDIVDSAGWTPLHDAANHGRTKIVEFLLDKGAYIEHTGPSIDCSTPLMEAVHGGNLGTATVLIERGADLWHKNRQGENLGDCIDDWRQRCKDNNSYGELEAKDYKNIMSFIKKKLGNQYIEWCRQRRGNIKSFTISSSVKVQKKENKSFIDHRRIVNTGNSDSDDTGSRSYTESPVKDYLKTINALKPKSKGEISSEPSESKGVNPEVGYVIGDDWIEDDMPSTSKKIVKEPDYGGYIRKRRKRSSESIYDEEISKPNRKKKNIKPSQSPSPENSTESFNTSGDTNQLSYNQTSQIDDLFNDARSAISFPRVSNRTTITVVYRSVSMLVPISDGCTVEWLILETIRRYFLLNPSDKSIPRNEQIRISTEDGSLMLPSDSLVDIISGLGNGPIRFMATDIKIIHE